MGASHYAEQSEDPLRLGVCFRESRLDAGSDRCMSYRRDLLLGCRAGVGAAFRGNRILMIVVAAVNLLGAFALSRVDSRP
jgi:hypothetical protein